MAGRSRRTSAERKILKALAKAADLAMTLSGSRRKTWDYLCGAVNAKTGRVCVNPCLRGSTACRFHGGATPSGWAWHECRRVAQADRAAYMARRAYGRKRNGECGVAAAVRGDIVDSGGDTVDRIYDLSDAEGGRGGR